MGSPTAHRPHHPGTWLTRRALLRDLGSTVAVLALAACTDSSASGDGPTSSSPAPTGSDPPGDPSSGTTPGAATSSPDADGLRWERVIGGVSAAYVLVREGEATVVDTGQPGSEGAIADGLAALGLDWGAVARVLLTHKHPDHVGSLGAVADLAPDADLLAGAGDLDAIGGPREVVAVGAGERVMGLQVVETPGHTPGHLSVFDAATGVLVAGDALNGTQEGGVAGPNPDFTPDMDTAWVSAAALAALRPDVILFGHGPPATEDAAAALAGVVEEAEDG